MTVQFHWTAGFLASMGDFRSARCSDTRSLSPLAGEGRDGGMWRAQRGFACNQRDHEWVLEPLGFDINKLVVRLAKETGWGAETTSAKKRSKQQSWKSARQTQMNI